MESQHDEAHLGIKLTKAPPRWLFFAVFAISGFSGLIYESIWSHYLKLFLGHAAYAQSLVLMIFMGGLALGSWLTARFSGRLRTPILAYALVEAVIGIAALLFHESFVALSDGFYFSLLPALETPMLAGLLKWLAASLLILPQSVLLGTTFPLMATGMLRRYPQGQGSSLATLYFTNSLGAAVGVLVSGFLLIGLVGLPGTIMTAGLLNLALALIVFILVRLDPEPRHEFKAEPRQPKDKHEPDALVVLFFVAAGITGAASFIYEIAWLRMLSLVLGATTHSFELMLSAFITGLALGGLWIKRRIDSLGDPVRFAGWVQVIMGLFAIATVPLYIQTFDWMAALLSGLARSDAGYGLFTGVSHLIALAVMLPTTFMAGMTLPLFTHVLMKGRQGERAVGRVYAANTVGAIAGVLFAVHVGLPLLGLKFLIAFGAVLDIVLGIVLLRRFEQNQRYAPGTSPALRAGLMGGVTIALVVSLIELEPRRLSSGVYRYNFAELEETDRILYYRDGKTASIALVAQGSRVSITTNGKPDAAIEMDPDKPRAPDEITMFMAAAIPLAYKPDARRVANIGLGSGITTHTFLGSESIELVDTIEIEVTVTEAARGFGVRVERAFLDPRSRIHIEDAKTFFSLQNEQYDIIVAEPSNPWVSGVASLFSREFYRALPMYLSDDGIFVQWLQLYEFNDELVISVLRALSESFEDYAIYNTDDTNVLIVAKPEGRLAAPDFNRVLGGRLRSEGELVGLNSEADFLVRLTGSPEILRGLLDYSGTPANSDYFPFLDLNAGLARYKQEVATLFYRWSVSALPLLEMSGASRFDFSAVTPDPHFQRTMAIGRARQLRRLVSSEVESEAAPGIAAPGLAITALRLLGRDCQVGEYEDDWLLAIQTVVDSTLATSDSESALTMLETIYPSSCRGEEGRLAAWYDLYLAIAARDAARMAASAEIVLERDQDADANRRLYAYTAALLGHLADGEARRVIELWDQRTALLRGSVMTPEIELIVRMAQSSLLVSR